MTVTNHESDMDIFGHEDVARYRDEWRSLQAGFVDDPAGAVRAADRLVEQVMEAMSRRLTESRGRLADGDGDEGRRTEQLRLALRGYRTLFQQLTGAS